MRDRPNRPSPRSVLASELVRRLRPDDWSVVNPDEAPRRILVALTLSMTDDFAAVVEVDGFSTTHSGTFPVDLFFPRVGVTYQPLRRLSPLLGLKFSLAHISSNLFQESSRRWPQSIARPQQAVEFAEEVSVTVKDGGIQFAKEHATLDAMLAKHRGDILMTAALLAANRQFGEADAALTVFEVSGPVHDQEYARAAYQLRRWVDNKGNLALPPPRPAGVSEPTMPARRWLSKAVATELSRQMSKRLAFRAARPSARDQGRDETRERLKSEYQRHGLNESPLSLERAVDRLHVGSGETDAASEDTAEPKNVARLVKRISSLNRVPEWLAPPVCARYRAPTGPDDLWDLVELDPTGIDWLGKVYDEAPRIGNLCVGLQAWLDSPEPETVDGLLRVNLGSRRVGFVSAAAAAPYVSILSEAASYGELPCLVARLSRRAVDDSYLLEIRRPSATPPPSQPNTVTNIQNDKDYKEASKDDLDPLLRVEY